jgi:hypothetical protein
MKRLIVVGVLVLGGCSWGNPPPPDRRITPGARILYNSGVGDTIFAICDKGDRIILTEKSPQMVVIPGGCPSGQP